jgi:Putative auto-transporter adhesin, head GIN domain
MSSPRRAPLLFPAAVAALALASCTIGDDGPRTTQTRDVADFTRIDNRDAVDVRPHVGGPQRVRIFAGEKVIDDVRTEVRDGTLRLTFDHDGFGGGDVVVEASVPKLTGIEASGSGDIDADGIDADCVRGPLGRLGRYRARGHGRTARGRPGRLGRCGSRRPGGARGARGRGWLG